MTPRKKKLPSIHIDDENCLCPDCSAQRRANWHAGGIDAPWTSEQVAAAWAMVAAVVCFGILALCYARGHA